MEFFEPFGDPGFEAEHEGGNDRTKLWIEFGENGDYHIVDFGVDGDGFQGLDNVDGEVDQLLGYLFDCVDVEVGDGGLAVFGKEELAVFVVVDEEVLGED